MDAWMITVGEVPQIDPLFDVKRNFKLTDRSVSSTHRDVFLFAVARRVAKEVLSVYKTAQ